MSHAGSVLRRILRFPGNRQEVIVAAGIPGIAGDGGFLTAPIDEVGAGNVNEASLSSQLLTIPPSAGESVRAIVIAPDSAIHTCDIAFRGRSGDIERHRCSPGNPVFLGCGDDADFAEVSIPWSLPDMPREDIGVADGGTGDATKVSVHDAIDYTDVEPSPGWPLRLELWRGDVLPMRTHQRAPYCAHWRGTLETPDETIEHRELLICVDGRRRVDVYVLSEGASITVSMFDHIGWKSGNPYEDRGPYIGEAISLPLTDAGSTSEVVATAVPRVFSFAGNPMGILRVHLTIAGTEVASATSDFQVKIRAED